MNWLMYICGGILWSAVWHSKGAEQSDKWCLFFVSLPVWIWICWRFIK